MKTTITIDRQDLEPIRQNIPPYRPRRANLEVMEAYAKLADEPKETDSLLGLTPPNTDREELL